MGCFGCLGRLGCLVFLLAAAAVALIFFLAARPVGPRYLDGAFTYQVGGSSRVVRLSDEAARRFDAKVNGNIPQSELLEAVTRGVPVTEAELNSRLAEELARQPLRGTGARVERVFIRIGAAGTRAYVYTSVRGIPFVLEGDLAIRAGNGAVEARLTEIHVGRLPLDPLLPAILRALSDYGGVADRISLVIPRDVRSIHTEEGQLRVIINPLGGP